MTDTSGLAVPTGSVGRVEIRGNSVAGSYWSLHGPTPAPVSAGGWLDTGDLGKVDADGFLFLTGRADDVINRGGEKVYPREVEDVLHGDPRVSAAVVVARPDPVAGNQPVAFVVAERTADAEQLRRDLEQRCCDQLSRFKRPASITVARSLPAGPTGKIRRSDVQRLAAAGL